MKAILVVDLPEEYVGSVIDVKLYSKTNVVHEYHEQYVNKLKPMPQKRYSLECGDSDGNKWREPSEYDMGYNKCIDDILEDR